MLGLFFLSSIMATSFNSNGQPIGDSIQSLQKDDTFSFTFDRPYGILILRDWTGCTLSYNMLDLSLNESYSASIQQVEKWNQNIIAAFSSFSTGRITLTATTATTVSFAWATFPDDCSSIYLQNLKEGQVQIEKLSSSPSGTFCYFNSIGNPLQYNINYNITSTQAVSILSASVNETLEVIKGHGTIQGTVKEAAIFKINNVSFVDAKSEYLTLSTKAENVPNPSFKYNGFISPPSQRLFFIRNTSSNKSTNMMIIILSCIAGFASFAFLIFLITAIIKKKLPKAPTPYNDSTEETELSRLSRPPTPEHIQIETFQSDSCHEISEDTSIPEFKDEFTFDQEGYPQNDYNPSNVEYTVPKPKLLKTVLNEVNAKT